MEGGLDTNDYAYVKDPINEFDLDGNGFCVGGHNPKKKGEKHGGCRGGSKARAVGRGARWVYRHTEVGVSVCVVRCVGIGTQGGTIYSQTGWGCCFVGPNVGIARREYSDRACNSFGGTASLGPVGAYGDMGIYGNPKQRGGLAPSGDFSGGWSPGFGAGMAGMTNRDILGQRSC